MPLQVLSGTASHVGQGSDFAYTASPISNQMIAQHLNVFSFRIDGKPVTHRTGTFLSISQGDKVAVAGEVNNGVFEAVAFRNLTTGQNYAPPTGSTLLAGWMMILLGIPLIILMGAGLALIGFGIWMISKAARVSKAAEMLRTIT